MLAHSAQRSGSLLLWPDPPAPSLHNHAAYIQQPKQPYMHKCYTLSLLSTDNAAVLKSKAVKH